LLLLIDAEHILDGERLEVELVRGVIVGRDGFWIAVDHYRLQPLVTQRKGGMHAAIVELDPLANTIGSTAQYHHLATITRGHFVWGVVGRIEVGCVVHATNSHRLPALHDTQCLASLANGTLGNTQDLGQVPVRKAIPLGLGQQVIGQHPAPILQQPLLKLDQFLHLLDEPRLDVGPRIQFFDVSALAQCFIHDELALTGWLAQHAHQFR